MKEVVERENFKNYASYNERVCVLAVDPSVVTIDTHCDWATGEFSIEYKQRIASPNV